jgi:SnoaL-like domain
MSLSHTELVTRVVDAMNRGDLDDLSGLLTEDYEESYPQSGEHTHGPAHFSAGPWGLTADADPTLPRFELVQLQEHGDRGTAVLQVSFADGSIWWMPVLYERRGDRLRRATAFLAPPFDPPRWRSAWVELGHLGVAPSLGDQDTAPAVLSHERLVERLLALMNGGRTGDDLWAEDFVEVYPQSGELTRGPVNAWAIRQNYPGGVQRNSQTVTDLMGDRDRWEITPMFTVVRIEEYGRQGTTCLRVRYPDASTWWLTVLYERRGDLIARATTFFAPALEPAPG